LIEDKGLETMDKRKRRKEKREKEKISIY